MISNTDNQLWPSHKSIPEDVKEEGEWYYDRNDIGYYPEERFQIESTLQSPHVKLHELPDDLNDSTLHISQLTNDSVKLGFGIGLSLLFLILIIVVIIHRERSRQNLQSENDRNRNSYDWNFCLRCSLNGKKTIKKMTGISIGKSQNYYKDNDRCHQHIDNIENLWLLEKSRLVVFHEVKLGSGAFCNVYKGAINGLAPICKVNPSLSTYGTFKDCMCAVKMLPSIADDIAHADFMQEIKFMKSLKYHPHLVSMLGISIDEDGNIMLLIEYCDLGDLLHLVRNKKDEIIMNRKNEHSKLRIKDLISFSWQISNGLEYLSSIGYVHRDVAARNVLVKATNICKIADFGLCRLSDSFIYTGRGGRLPLKWMAPESLRSYEYSIKTDVWSYGVLLYEVFSFGEVPYALLQTTEILDFLNSGARLHQPQYCPINVYTLMLQCWQSEPSLRPNFTEICSILRMILEDNFEHYGYVEEVNANGNPIY
ncbi:Protein tyrosine kinase family protein [Acanthocheilonema viteae]